MGGIIGQKGAMGGVLMFQGQIGKIAPKIPGKSGVFSILALFFHQSLPKIWHAHPHKNYIFGKSKDRAIFSQSLKLLSSLLFFLQAFEYWVFFGTFRQRSTKKHLLVKRFPW